MLLHARCLLEVVCFLSTTRVASLGGVLLTTKGCVPLGEAVARNWGGGDRGNV